MKYYVDFITKHATNKLTSFEKVKMIIRRVRQNRVIIIESGLTPQEEAELIKQTMMVIDFEQFFGIEFFNWDRTSSGPRRLFKKSAPNTDSQFTVIAPSDAIQVIENSEELLSLELYAPPA
ncbi:MAG: DUF2073 domain-containing protein [Candidatus Heimdallarchaeota archaeon]|nr:DUF2073 domain-containing protein [Candidatus Heimdallarchaeota archaeon]